MSTRMALVLLLASVYAVGAAGAQDAQGDATAFADPTRPPNLVDATSDTVAARTPRLQSVLIAPGRRHAVINGELVRQGGTYGKATVVRVSATSVLLRFPDGDQTLELLPGIEKSHWSDRGPKNANVRRMKP
jgi:hypothetical protein